jgi:hypothetical protein
MLMSEMLGPTAEPLKRAVSSHEMFTMSRLYFLASRLDLRSETISLVFSMACSYSDGGCGAALAPEPMSPQRGLLIFMASPYVDASTCGAPREARGVRVG